MHAAGETVSLLAESYSPTLEHLTPLHSTPALQDNARTTEVWEFANDAGMGGGGGMGMMRNLLIEV